MLHCKYCNDHTARSVYEFWSGSSAQYHEIKEETFRVIYGKIELTINDKPTILCQGDEYLVRSRDIHSFKAITDCIIEELSTISIPADSYYLDPHINKLSRDERKTYRTSY